MALPKKGTRVIDVDGTRYRYVGDATRLEGEDSGELIVELADSPREKIRATFTYTRLNTAYQRVGHALSHIRDRMPPFVVRQTILYALTQGWKPDLGGGVRDLGNLDDAIDFSELRPRSQDPQTTKR
ncbi:MAG: hypothetical protein AAGE52_31585 [Myxococcota bacterium]